MDCQQAQPFVSALHDGETVPKEAAEHIGGCALCKERLQEYAQMGAELRLLASTDPPGASGTLPFLPSQGRRWTHTLTTRILVPRFALGLGIVAILGLSVGLGLVRAQGPLWFQFDVSSPNARGASSMGNLLLASKSSGGFLSVGPGKKVGYRIQAMDVQSDHVRLLVWARAFESETESKQMWDRILTSTTPHEFNYSPGQTLKIPVEGGGTVELTGKVFKLRPSFDANWFPVMPKPNEIVLSQGALVQGNTFLGEIGGGASAGGGTSGNPAFGICVPKVGALVFALKPFEGAVPGVAEYGQVHFTINGQAYALFSATPITGGDQPRKIWIYNAPSCPPSWGSTGKTPMMIGSSGDVSGVLDMLRK
jgi:hypothetical protein